MNILFVHPISCNIALKTLSDDQSSSGTGLMLRLLSILMNSDGSVPDDIEGLIYQTMALIDLQSDEGVEGITEGVDKASTPSRQAIVHKWLNRWPSSTLKCRKPDCESATHRRSPDVQMYVVLYVVHVSMYICCFCDARYDAS